MKHLTQRACALMLALTLALTLFPVTALAAGSVSYDVTTQLGPGLTLTQTNARTDAGVYRQSFALDHDPPLRGKPGDLCPQQCAHGGGGLSLHHGF